MLTTRQVEEGVLEAILALAKDDPLCEALSGQSASPRAWDGSSMTPVQVVIGAARAFRDHLASMDAPTRREAFRAIALVVGATPTPRAHVKTILPEFAAPIEDGSKPWELRCGDMDPVEGDSVELRSTDLPDGDVGIRRRVGRVFAFSMDLLREWFGEERLEEHGLVVFSLLGEEREIPDVEDRESAVVRAAQVVADNHGRGMLSMAALGDLRAELETLRTGIPRTP
jgi:hypothetical protein